MIAIQSGTVEGEEFRDAPIPPAQILSGSPIARSRDLSHSRDVSMNVWDCTAGRFEWRFGGDELVQILAGEVHVTDESGRTTVLSAGSTAHFAAGSRMVWDVPVYVRKLAFHHAPPTLAGRIARRVRIELSRSLAGRVPVGLAPLASGLTPMVNGLAPLI